jgi:hypothetical protein
MDSVRADVGGQVSGGSCVEIYQARSRELGYGGSDLIVDARDLRRPRPDVGKCIRRGGVERRNRRNDHPGVRILPVNIVEKVRQMCRNGGAPIEFCYSFRFVVRIRDESQRVTQPYGLKGSVPHFPVHTGGRFSRKALTPSLGEEVLASFMGMGSGLTITRANRVNHGRVQFEAVIIPEPQTLHDAGAKVVYEPRLHRQSASSPVESMTRIPVKGRVEGKLCAVPSV